MSKLIPFYKTNPSDIIGYLFCCPGCGMHHEVTIAPNKNVKGASWTFNGDKDKPTFSPSILCRIEYQGLRPPAVPGGYRQETGGTMSDRPTKICHSFVTDGKIRFLSDCTHDKAGQTLQLPECEP
ncbi:MAG: DUF6527 family protein [Xenococcaceae cyanobacterium]